MLDMQDIEQDILRCLNRQPGLTLAEIASALAATADEVKAALHQMINRLQIIEEFQNGQSVYSVQYGQLETRAVNMSGSLLDLFQDT